MNPNFVVDNNSNNKLPSPKQKQMNNNNNNQLNETITNVEHTNIPQLIDSNNQSEIDDDTRCLMMLHEQIVPTPNLVS